MCARYSVTISEKDLIRLFDVEPDGVEIQRFNVAPMQDIPVVVEEGGRRSLELYRWGLVPYWADDEKIGQQMINARAETIFEKSAYREAAHKRRCLIPASGFYEWREEQGRKQPYYFRLKSGELMAFAGLRERKRLPQGELRTCTVITTEPNELVRPFHDRMPAVLKPDEFGNWLQGQKSATELLPLLTPIDSEELEVFAVTPRLNRVDYEGSDSITPIEPDQATLF